MDFSLDAVAAAVAAAAAHLSEQAPAPAASALLAAFAAGLLLTVWGPSRAIAQQLGTIAHEGGHALAALLTGRRVTGVHVHRDGSGLTYTRGRPRGFGAALVSFAGYPAPAIAGAALLAGAVSATPRLWAAGSALMLVLLLWRTRNLHGWMMILLASAGAGAAAWYLPTGVLAACLAGLGAILFVGAIRSLLSERRARRDGSRGSDVAALAARGRLPAAVYWGMMLAVVAGSGWAAWASWAAVYPGLLG